MLRPVTVLWRGSLAHEYAVAVLSRAGNLVQGLDRDTLSALGSHPALSAEPQLAAAVARALDRDASATWHTGRWSELVRRRGEGGGLCGHWVAGNRRGWQWAPPQTTLININLLKPLEKDPSASQTHHRLQPRHTRW